MAEDKKEAAPAPFKKSIYNKGPRFYHLRSLDTGKKDSNGKPIMTERVLGPGSSIDVLDQAEYDHLIQYRDVVDTDKFVPGGNDRIAKLEQEKAELQARIAELEDLTAEKGGEAKPKKGK